MVKKVPFQHFLTDNESLAQYCSGSYPAFADVKRRLLLKTREQDKTIPDHHYRLLIESAYKDVHEISDIFSLALPKLAAQYLYQSENIIHVVTNAQNDFQELITRFPPLLLQCLLIHKNETSKLSGDDIPTFFRDKLLPNTKYTCIPSASITQLNFYIRQQKGLHDLHMHLNGALETDQVWQDYLQSPQNVYHELKSAFKNEKVREQLEQESVLLEAKKFRDLLIAAQNLRSFFFNYLFDPQAGNMQATAQTLLNEILKTDGAIRGSYKHPFQQLITSNNNFDHLMSVEGLMYVLILQEIREYRSPILSNLFHFYLLILGLTNRLLVQQTHQNGFEQFQKHTLNGMRNLSEREYRRRYYQLHGNNFNNIKFLEGRFSPKKDKNDTKIILDKIITGWEKLGNTILENAENTTVTPNIPVLKLIAHFIKSAETPQNLHPTIRHKALRYDTWMKAKSLSFLLKDHPHYRSNVVAVDAAASEFDAPPEVFAPAFRLMRKTGLKHFTYHAGEDFYHILSGLRAIYEAITFCDLTNGDRIGHATATGLSTKLWQACIGTSLLIRQGEHLDNLVFAYDFIVEYKHEALYNTLPFLVNQIQNLTHSIYNESYSIETMIFAWKLRKYCPVHLLENQMNDITGDQKSEYEWNLPRQSHLHETTDMESNSAWRVYRDYHSTTTRKKQDKIIEINPFAIFSAEALQTLQRGLLAEMNRREIVIETLPTSNVRIGFHNNFSSYHLWNWIAWKKEGHSIPPIIVGSDDTGIFGTNIYNEYANIYCMLLNEHHLSQSEIMTVIKQLDEDSHIYRFE